MINVGTKGVMSPVSVKRVIYTLLFDLRVTTFDVNTVDIDSKDCETLKFHFTIGFLISFSILIYYLVY